MENGIHFDSHFVEEGKRILCMEKYWKKCTIC